MGSRLKMALTIARIAYHLLPIMPRLVYTVGSALLSHYRYSEEYRELAARMGACPTCLGAVGPCPYHRKFAEWIRDTGELPPDVGYVFTGDDEAPFEYFGQDPGEHNQ